MTLQHKAMLPANVTEPQRLPHTRVVKRNRTKSRKEQFVEAATRSMERHGYHAMTMETLAAEAGVSVGLAYYYFKSKSDVLLAVIVDILERYRQQLPVAMATKDDPVERLGAGFNAYLKVIDSHRHAAVLAYRESKTLPKRGRERIKKLELETTSLLADQVRAGSEAGLLVDASPMMSAYNLIIVAHMWALKYWYFQPLMTVDEYATQQLAFTLSAIVTPSHRRRYAHLLHAPARSR